MSLTPCTSFFDDHWPAKQNSWPGDQNSWCIGKATPEEFDTLKDEHPDFNLKNFGYLILRESIDNENKRLVEHIIKLTDKSILNMGDSEGRTLLYRVTNLYKDSSSRGPLLSIAKTLIYSGAHVNICKNDWQKCRDFSKDFGYTILENASFSQDPKLVKWLLRQKAVILPQRGTPGSGPISEGGKFISSMKANLDQEEVFLLCCHRLRKENPAKALPRHIVSGILFYLEKMTTSG